MSSRSVYVGNLPRGVRERDIEDVFSKYGRIEHIDIKDRSSPVFAFVEFEDPRDADDAVRGRDGYDMDGNRLRVEMTRGAGPRGQGGRPLFSSGDNRSRGEPPRRGQFRILVTGLPKSGSWQDLKDHMRSVGDVCYADVHHGEGVVEFTRREDYEQALRKFDDTKFRSHEGETSYIRVRPDDGGSSSRKRSRSRSPGRRRSPSRSRSRSRTPRRRTSSPRSPGSSPRRPAGNRNRSTSRSRSRSPLD